jgi:hypothetical protein
VARPDGLIRRVSRCEKPAGVRLTAFGATLEKLGGKERSLQAFLDRR